MSQELQQVTTIPADLGERSRGGFNTKYLVGGLLLLLFVAILGYQMFQATATTGAYYMTVAEVQERASALFGQRVRVSGTVVDGSEDWNPQDITLKFAIADEGGKTLPIVFYGPRPDNFQRAASAIVEGELLPNGSFQAETLLLKCPSRYEEAPEEVFVKSNH